MCDLKSRGQTLEISQAESKTIKVLLIEDNPGDVRLVMEMLLEAGAKRFSLEHASSIREGLALLSQKSYEVTLLDLSLPDGQGLDTIRRVCPASPHLPVIILTGLSDETIAVRAVQEGAQDYLVKGQMNSTLLVRAIRYAIERKRIEEALREEEDRFRQLFDEAPVRYHEIDSSGRIVSVNQTELEMLGYGRVEMVGEPFWKFILDEEMAKKAFEANFSERLSRCKSCEWHYRKKDGSLLAVISEDKLLRDREGKTIGLRTTIQDITEWKRTAKEKEELQAQLRQSQKIEAIGRLAGGIAHDFNNLLTVITGDCQLSLLELNKKDPLRENIEEIKRASEKAADLTRQLLAFSRRQILDVKVLDLNTVLRDLDKMLRRLIGEDIELVTVLTDGLGRVKTDPGWVEQIIINLAVNAKDAMPDGGKLMIETANVELDEAYARGHIAVKPGHYVMLSVSDTGVGMTPEVRQQVFEPFFTTKEKGKGTGLGLSTVYGIVKQSEGNIWVYSEPGQGTTFKIYLPRVDELLEELKERVIKDELPRGNGTILVVEDEEGVRKLAVRILKRQGYMVLDAPDGEGALVICEERKGPIDLILTDVVMPGMSGPQFVNQYSQVGQDFKVLYMSGYTDNAIFHKGVLRRGINYLQKPFTTDTLSKKVREVLDKNSKRAP